MADRPEDNAYGQHDTRGRGTDTANGGSPAGPAETNVVTASGLNVLLGLWLIMAPWVLDYSGQNNAVWNQVVIGIAIASLAVIRVLAPDRAAGLSWTNFALGAWLIIAPFLLTYNDTGDTAVIYWNDIIVGLLVLALAAWSAVSTRDHARVGR